jgi:hypothetical protein
MPHLLGGGGYSLLWEGCLRLPLGLLWDVCVPCKMHQLGGLHLSSQADYAVEVAMVQG